MPDLTELRDELARVCGCEKVGDGWYVPKESGDAFVWSEDHPFAPNDLSALAAVWPEDESLVIETPTPYGCSWEARSLAKCEAADTEYEARLRLTLAVLKEKAHA